MDNQNISPVGWYIGSYLLRFIEIEQVNNDDPEVRFLSWENTILVKANNLDEAYDKVVDHAKVETEPYKGGPNGVPVKWVFEGVTELLPIYEQLEDGAEIMWCERRPTKLKNLRRKVRKRGEFSQ
jgi:hypothetical protein